VIAMEMADDHIGRFVQRTQDSLADLASYGDLFLG